jgi:hypothetical protein
MGFMNGGMDDDDDDEDDKHVEPASKSQDKPPPPATLPAPAVPTNHQRPIPLAAPRPGYAAPVAAFNLSQPSSVAARGRTQVAPMKINVPPANLFVQHRTQPPPSPISVPSTPHPLQPPITPILPAFARPPKDPAPREGVTFVHTEAIMRGTSEDVLLPKRGEAGDDFWRRFSMVVKEENQKTPRLRERYCLPLPPPASSY